MKYQTGEEPQINDDVEINAKSDDVYNGCKGKVIEVREDNIIVDVGDKFFPRLQFYSNECKLIKRG